MIHLKTLLPNHQKLMNKIVKECKFKKTGNNIDKRLIDPDSSKNSKTTQMIMKWFQQSLENLGFPCYYDSAQMNYYREGENCFFHHDYSEYNTLNVVISFGTTTILELKNDQETISFELEGGDVLIFDSETDKKYKHGISSISGDRLSFAISILGMPGIDINDLLPILQKSKSGNTNMTNEFLKFNETDYTREIQDYPDLPFELHMISKDKYIYFTPEEGKIEFNSLVELEDFIGYKLSEIY